MNVKTPSIRNFYHGNYTDINKFLSGVDWISVFKSTLDINSIYTTVTNIVNESIKTFISPYRVNKKPYKIFKEFTAFEKPLIQTN